MIIYGGSTSGGNNSAVYILANANGVSGTPGWSQLSTSAGPPTGKNGPSGAYDRANNRLIVFGGCDGAVGCSSPTNETWVLSNANGLGGQAQWAKLAPSGTMPPARSVNAAVYDGTHNRLIIFAGGGSGGLLNDVWVLSNANGLGGSPSWTRLLPSGATPGARYGSSAVYDPASNRMTIFGGDNGGFLKYSDTWVLANANGLGGTPTWTQIPAPTADRYNMAYVFDVTANALTIFGGVTQGTLKNDVARLSSANGSGAASQWTPVTVSGTPPAIRESHPAAVLDPNSGRILIFGGAGTVFYNDLWALVPSANTCSADITSKLDIVVRGYRFNRASQNFEQVVYIRDNSPLTSGIGGLVTLVLDSLTPGVSLVNGGPNTACAPPLGSPTFVASLAPEGVGVSSPASATVVLQFSDPTLAPIRSNPRVLAWSGAH